MYKIIIDTKAMEFLEKLPKSIAQRILKKIQETKENPHRYFIKLTNRTEYKLRVGNYRIISEIKDNKLKILIIHIGHRSKVYKQI